MKKLINYFKSLAVWFIRFRHRCGYGVHSPFAYNLITEVIYEKGFYYAYEDLLQKGKSLPCIEQKKTSYNLKINRLLFRLANYVHPMQIVIIGKDLSDSIAYLQAGSIYAKVHYLEDRNLFEETFHKIPNIGLLYLKSIDFDQDIFEKVSSKITEKSLLIIEGIHQTKEKKGYWKKLIKDSRCGITFDLYDMGLIFFDLSKNKQHYIVNF